MRLEAAAWTHFLLKPGKATGSMRDRTSNSDVKVSRRSAELVVVLWGRFGEPDPASVWTPSGGR